VEGGVGPNSKADRSAWCRQHGVYAAELDKWQARATAALAKPEEARANPQATGADRKRMKELERDLLRKDRALAETAALPVLSNKVAAIFNKGEDERSAPKIARRWPETSRWCRAPARGYAQPADRRRRRSAHAAALEGPARAHSGRW